MPSAARARRRACCISAALEAGAPEDIIRCITTPTIEATNALMRHERTGVILSTGGHGIVKAAYSSGKPAFGVGPGNVPVLIERTADVADAIGKIVEGKSFDYGTVCSSEQAMVAEEPLRERDCRASSKRAKHFSAMRRRKTRWRKLLLTPQFDRQSEMRGPAGAEDRADGRIRSARGYAGAGGGIGRRGQGASALGRETFAGAVTIFREGFRGRR